MLKLFKFKLKRLLNYQLNETFSNFYHFLSTNYKLHQNTFTFGFLLIIIHCCYRTFQSYIIQFDFFQHKFNIGEKWVFIFVVLFFFGWKYLQRLKNAISAFENIDKFIFGIKSMAFRIWDRLMSITQILLRQTGATFDRTTKGTVLLNGIYAYICIIDIQIMQLHAIILLTIQ